MPKYPSVFSKTVKVTSIYIITYKRCYTLPKLSISTISKVDPLAATVWNMEPSPGSSNIILMITTIVLAFDLIQYGVRVSSSVAAQRVFSLRRE